MANTQPFVLIYSHLSPVGCSATGWHLPAAEDAEDTGILAIGSQGSGPGHCIGGGEGRDGIILSGIQKYENNHVQEATLV